MTHPVVASLLAGVPCVGLHRAAISSDGEYRHHDQVILIRNGLRGPAWISTVVHEALHALRGDRPCCTAEMEARQEAIVERDAARLLIDIRDLAAAAAAYHGDAHLIAEELGVTYEMVATRVKHLHPAERHYLHRRLEHLEETA